MPGRKGRRGSRPTPPLPPPHADGWCARGPPLRTLSTPEEGNTSMVILAGIQQAPIWLHGKIGRKGDKTYRMRFVAQAGFAFVCVLLGFQFARFVSAARAGRMPLPHRPPGVEGFLPISGLMGLVDWARTGTLNAIHPAAAVL